MAIQDDIRDDTAQCVRLGICAYQHLGFENPEMYYKIADEVLKSQPRRGVVIKVERKLPLVIHKSCVAIWGETATINTYCLSECNCVAVEPLIKEVAKDG